MTTDSSATVREETPHVTETIQFTISHALRRRAQSVINDRWIDPQWRSIIRYALEINDPCLPDLVQRADAGETIIDTIDLSERAENNEADLSEKIEALAEIICRSGAEPAAALLVLMATVETGWHPRALANTAKHLAFTRCGELNLFGMVDAQIAIAEDKLLAEIALS